MPCSEHKAGAPKIAKVGGSEWPLSQACLAARGSLRAFPGDLRKLWLRRWLVVRYTALSALLF